MIVPFGLAPSDEVAVILQFAGLGALIGSAFAARMKMRNPDADVTLPPIMWALLGALVTLAVLAVKGVL